MPTVPLSLLILSKSDVNIGYLSDALASYRLAVCRNRDELLRHIADTDVVVAQNKGFTFRTIDQEVLARATRLRLIQHFGVQWDITDVEEAARLGIPVAIVSGQNTRSVAEHACHLMLCLAKRVRLAQESVRAGTMGELVSVEIADKTLAIVGFGRIGKTVARIARGFSMRVIGVDKVPDLAATAELQLDALYPAAELHRALTTADIVVLTVPLNTETFNLIGPPEFAAMKAGAFLVNVSRGPHVDRDALKHALASGKLAGFAADVFWEEPANPDDSLLNNPRAYFTPHIAGQTHEVLARVTAAIRRNVELLSQGKPLLNVVNAPAAAGS